MNDKFYARMSLICCVVSALCSIVCLGCIIFGFPTHGNLRFDYMGVIVAILGILVTALIGWQVLQAILIEDKIKDIAEEKAIEVAIETANMEMDDMLSDVRIISKSSLHLFDAKFYRVIGKNLHCVHSYMTAIQEYLTIRNKKFSSLLIEDVLQQILTLPSRFQDNGHLVVYKDQIENYKKMIADTDCPSTDKIQDLLSQSHLQDKESSNTVSCFYTD